MKITWLTQSGYLIEHDGCRLVIDPYLSDAAVAKGANRRIPPPLDAATLAPDFLICTHNHVDHWDPIGAPEIISLHPKCKLIAPVSVRILALAAGFDATRMEALDVGEKITAGPFHITALPTLHSDPHGVGLLIEAGNRRIYHSGDTDYTTPLAKDLHDRVGQTPDLALICINGRLGNMTWQEAALLAERLQPRLTVPNHYDLFHENQQDPAPFIERCRLLGLDARAFVAGRAETLNQHTPH